MGSYETAGYSLGDTMASGYIDPSDVSAKHLQQMKDEFYLSNYTAASTQWIQGAIDKRFKVGDQSLYSAATSQNNYLQAYRFFFNLIRRHSNMIVGRQRQSRKSTVTIPQHDRDDSLSDEYNTVMKWCDDRDGFQEYLSEAFEGCIDTGETLLHLYPDYTLDPISGDLFTDSVAYNNYLIDQFYRKQDLSDCNGIWRRRWTSKIGAKQMLPGYGAEIDHLRPGGMKDGRFPIQAELFNANVHKLFTYDEFYYRTTREAHIILDPKTGEAVEWEEDEQGGKDEMKRVLAQQPWLIAKKTQVPTVKLVISLGDKTVYHGPNLLGIDAYPFIPCQCYAEPDIISPAWRKMGIIRNMRDPQFLYNMRKVIELQMLQSSLNSGWIYPVDVVVDTKAFRQSGGDGFLVPLKSGHLPNEIQRIEPVAIPQSLMELSKSLADDITKISGVNEELLGSATDDKSGILSMLRQGSSLTTLQTIFDKLDYSQRLYGKIRLQAIRKNFSKGKVTNILGHEPDPRFFTSHSQKYSITVEEGNYSANQRQIELQQLLNAKELGIPIANKSIVRAMFLTNKEQIQQEMEEEVQQQAQQQQAQSQQQQKMDESKIMASMAKAKSDLAKERDLMASSQERLAKIDDLESSSERKDTESDLNLVKLMVELETLDMDHLRSSYELAQQIKKVNKAEALERKAELEQKQPAIAG